MILDAATTQEGFAGTPLIELDGGAVATLNDGFQIAASGSTVRGFVINRFLGDGIHLDGNNSIIAGNWIGLDASGTTELGNASPGVHVLGANNVIGGTGPNERNVISGNAAEGIRIDGAGATGNLVQGNFIGTDRTGTIALGNAGDGISIQGGASGQHHRRRRRGARNVIAGNLGDGSVFDGIGSTDNVIRGNYIGLDAAGTTAIGNGGSGIWLSGASGKTIGGTAPGARNVIAGNLVDGITGIGSSGQADPGQLRRDGCHRQRRDRQRRGRDLSPGRLEEHRRRHLGGSAQRDLGQRLVRAHLLGHRIGQRCPRATTSGPTPPVPVRSATSSRGCWSPTRGPTTIGGVAAGAGNVIAYNGWDGVEISAGTGHAVLGNSIYQNGDLGIDLGAVLGGDGPTPNDPGDGDTETNDLQNSRCSPARRPTGRP